MLRIIPNKNNVGAEIDTDLQKLSKQNLKIIINALNTYGMIFFRRQNLSSKHYVEFAKNFGKLADYPRLKGLNKKYPQITVVQRKKSDKGPSFGEQISFTTKERVKEKGKKIKELKSTHKIIRKISSNYAIYSSPGHLVGFQPKIKNEIDLKKKLFKHQIKKKFQHSLEWEKNQLAIWDNRSMLHQATPFKGNRIMHRITIL